MLLPYDYEWECFLEFHTKHFVADTGILEQSRRSRVAIIAGVQRLDNNEIISRPLIMGAPSYDHPANKSPDVDLMWYGWDWYEIFPEDIQEFAEMKNVPSDTADWLAIMPTISEESLKKHFCDLLGDVPKKDWGGELDDHFAASLYVGQQRTTAAFLLKGPTHFREMTPEILGKRADQIYRLASTPAQVLVVQHSHQIGEAVRATLRAFSVTPHNPRRYCLIDGKDTFRILKAYGKV
jgi:hypothetical protein